MLDSQNLRIDVKKSSEGVYDEARDDRNAEHVLKAAGGRWKVD
jgi:hypothetical protein